VRDAETRQREEPAELAQQASSKLELACFNARVRGRRAACEQGKAHVKDVRNSKTQAQKYRARKIDLPERHHAFKLNTIACNQCNECKTARAVHQHAVKAQILT
jgi:formylmethanofuran dehydrogenase subunit E